MKIDNKFIIFFVILLLFSILGTNILKVTATEISVVMNKITNGIGIAFNIEENEADKLNDNVGDLEITEESAIEQEESEKEETESAESEPTESEEDTNIPENENTPMPTLGELFPADSELIPSESELVTPAGGFEPTDEAAASARGNVEQDLSRAVEIIDAESVVVYNFDDFKSALSQNNKYVNVYLGANIDMKVGGIEINASKKKVMISGINPFDGSGPYSINENNSLDMGYTIRVTSNLGTKEVVVRDVNITGRNYYGAICVYDAASNVRITFENVEYNGPQLTYNRNGTLCITGDSHIRIIGGNGLSIAQELAEVEALELGGNTVIDHYSPALSGLWLVGNKASVTVLSDARVTWNETGTYMIYQDNLNPATFTMEENAELSINTINGLFFNNDIYYHQFGNVLIGSCAALKIEQQSQSPTSLPIMKVKNSFQIAKDGSLIIISQGVPQLLYMTGAVDFVANFPNTLALYNKTNPLITWNDSNNHKISINSTFMNYWENPCDTEILGSFEDAPLYRWRKKNGEDLSVEIITSSADTKPKSVISNYTEFDYGDGPTAETLKTQSARILTAGRMLLTIDMITDKSESISGETEANALLRILYTDGAGKTQTVYGSADSGGAYDITLPKGSFPLLNSMVEVHSSSVYKNVIEQSTVVKSPDNLLMFIHVPHNLLFPDTVIEARRSRIYREETNWHITVGDFRNQGARWGLYARLASPLRGTKSGVEHIVQDGVIFVDEDYNRMVLSDTAIKISEGFKAEDTETHIEWPEDRGIMLDVYLPKVYSDMDYSARIEWILIDAP